MQIEAFMHKAQSMLQNDQAMRNLYRSEGARLLLTSPLPGTLLHQRLMMINTLLERYGESLPHTGRSLATSTPRPPAAHVEFS
jgi:hypothetical protein